MLCKYNDTAAGLFFVLFCFLRGCRGQYHEITLHKRVRRIVADAVVRGYENLTEIRENSENARRGNAS